VPPSVKSIGGGQETSSQVNVAQRALRRIAFHCAYVAPHAMVNNHLTMSTTVQRGHTVTLPDDGVGIASDTIVGRSRP